MNTPCSLCKEDSFPELVFTYCANCYGKVVEERDTAQMGMKILERDNQLLLRKNFDLRQEINVLRQGEMKLGDV